MELQYTIKRSSKRKKLGITVERDRSIVVHAPMTLPDAKVQELVDSKRQWIYQKLQHPQKYQDLPHPPGKELVNGESALFLGYQYQIEFVTSGTKKIQFDRKFIIPEAMVTQKKDVMRRWYIEKAEEIILAKAQYYAKNLGVQYRSVNIVDNRYRWGSCTVADNLNFNWRLIKAPMFVIEYIVVHELAHLIESNHTARFWNIVKAQLATTEKAKRWLVENGQLLEEEI
ncbi:MAG: SprT family zinc-dependent metalloprotease [Spirochaetota bacterium]